MNKEYEEYLNFYRNKPETEEERKIVSDFFNIIKSRPIDVYKKEDRELVEKYLTDLFMAATKKYNSNDCTIEFDEENQNGQFTFIYSFDKDKRTFNYKDLKIKISTDSYIMEELNAKLGLRTYAFKYVLKCLYHEIEHYLQFKRLVTNVSSYDNLMFAKEYTITDLDFDDKENIKELYKINHDEFSIESGANHAAFQNISSIFDHFMTRNIRECSALKLDKALSPIVYNNIVYDRDELINKLLDKLVVENPYLLEKLKILQKEYNYDGSKKSSVNLILNLSNELGIIDNLKMNERDKQLLINDTFDMYYELIIKRLKEDQNDLDDLLNMVELEPLKNMLLDISEHFRKKKVYYSNLSRRKYEIREKLDTKKNNFRSVCSLDYIMSKEDGMIKAYNYDDFVFKFIYKDDDTQEIRKIKDIVSARIPKYGFFILKDGKSISILDYIEQYLIGKVDMNDLKNSIYNIAIKTVKTSRETDYQMELALINSKYQENKAFIDNIITEIDMEKKR